MNYWKQKATPWVSISVLAGGLVAACILFLVAKVENNVSNLGSVSEEQIFSALEQRSR